MTDEERAALDAADKIREGLKNTEDANEGNEGEDDGADTETGEDGKPKTEEKPKLSDNEAKQREAADAKVTAEKKRADDAEAATAKLLKQIEDLTTGQAFSNSKFVTEKLTLTPNKAKALYNSHFEFVEGKMVGYDKPKGDADRTPIVDATGETVDFETAIAAIIDADPDKDYLIKAEQKPGAGSKPKAGDVQVKGKEFIDTTDKIAAGLDAFIKQSSKK